MVNVLYYSAHLQAFHLNSKTGSNLDLIRSVKPNNLLTMLSAGVKEIDLTKYLVSQLMLKHEDRMNDLRVFVPMQKTKIGKLLLQVNVYK